MVSPKQNGTKIQCRSLGAVEFEQHKTVKTNKP